MKKGLVDPSPGSNSPRAQQSLGPPVLGPTSINTQIKKIFTRTSGSKEQWTLIPMVENYSRTTGPQYQWALGLVGFAKVGRCQDQWTLVLKNPSTLRPKYTWTLGLMDPRTSGPKDQWVIPVYIQLIVYISCSPFCRNTKGHIDQFNASISSLVSR